MKRKGRAGHIERPLLIASSAVQKKSRCLSISTAYATQLNMALCQSFSSPLPFQTFLWQGVNFFIWQFLIFLAKIRKK
jgi:hypothetical protein